MSRPGNVGLAGGVSIAHEDPRLLADLYALASRHPGSSFEVTSGDRSSQPASGPYPIAPEGRSLHELVAYARGRFDEAIDVVVNGTPIAYALSPGELAAAGVHAPVAGDPVHLTLLGVNG